MCKLLRRLRSVIIMVERERRRRRVTERDRVGEERRGRRDRE